MTKSSNGSSSDDLENKISKLIQEQFDSYQREIVEDNDDDDEVIDGFGRSPTMEAAMKYAKMIHKQLNILSLNDAMNDMSLTAVGGSKGDDGTSSRNDILTSILIRYIDSTMSIDVSSSGDNELHPEEKEKIVSRVMDLIVALYTTTIVVPSQDKEDGHGDNFDGGSVLDRVIHYSAVILERVRVQSCRLLGKLAHSLYHHVVANDLMKDDPNGSKRERVFEVYNQIKDAIIPRLTDKSQMVRNTAIDASGYVLLLSHSILSYDEDDGNDELLESITWNLWHDPSASNRMTTITALSRSLINDNDTSAGSLPPTMTMIVDHIVTRVRDVKDKVRVHAIQTISRSKCLVVSMLSLEQRYEIIRSGLVFSRCQQTKEATSKLLCSRWMKYVKFDPIELLKLFSVIENSNNGGNTSDDNVVCQQLVQALLETARGTTLSSGGDNKIPVALRELSIPEIRQFRTNVLEKSLISLDSNDIIITEPEQILYARIACSSTGDEAGDNSNDHVIMLNKVVPDIPVLCDIFQNQALRLIQAIMQNSSREGSNVDATGDEIDKECFICMQLLRLASIPSGLVVQEEGSRRYFATVMKRMLSANDTPDDLIEGCVSALLVATTTDSSSDTSCVDTINDIITEISSLDKAAETEENEQNDIEGDNEFIQIDKNRRLLRVLSILSIVFETVSPKILSSTPLVLEELATKYILPALQQRNNKKNHLIREAAVSCLGKLGLFITNNDLLMNNLRPMLLRIMSNSNDGNDERMEIRCQAMLAYCDWSLLYTNMLEPCMIPENDGDGNAISFIDLVQEFMMDSDNPSVSAIAAEVAIKLLFAGRICDSTMIAQLFMMFFDPTNEDNVDDEENASNVADIKEIGNPIRLQQLLSLFFPAYCIKSELGRDAMVGSIGSLLELATGAAAKKKKATSKKKSKKAVAYPVIKMLEYICSIAEDGLKTAAAAALNTTTANDRHQEHPLTPQTLRSQSDPMPSESGGETTKSSHVSSSSPTLLACIQVAAYLIQDSTNLTITLIRSLCKFLANYGEMIDIAQEPKNSDLVQLKDDMEELGMAITDATSLRSLAVLNDILVDVVPESEEENEEEEEEEAIMDQEVRNAAGGDDDDDDDETETENESNDEGDAETEDESSFTGNGRARARASRQSGSFVDHGLMDSLTTLSVRDDAPKSKGKASNRGGSSGKENDLPSGSTGKKRGMATTTSSRRSSVRSSVGSRSARVSSASTVSILESLGGDEY